MTSVSTSISRQAHSRGPFAWPTLPGECDCVIIGAGAAGLMCAITAARRGRHVVVLDHANKPGKKILMSGGGRCNFTNLAVEPDNFISGNPHFCKSALSRYTQWDFLALVQKHGLAYHEKTKGQLFCDHKAKDLLDILLAEVADAGAALFTKTAVEGLAKTEDGRFAIRTAGTSIAAESVVIATGGLSIPTMGATGFGYQIAEQFGLTMTRRDPSLVPFTAGAPENSLLAELAGVSLAVEVTCGSMSFRDQLLITHKGLSGPAVLQISNYWNPGEAVTIDLLPGYQLTELWQQWRADGVKAELKNALAAYLPKRFIQAWLGELGRKPIPALSAEDVRQCHEKLHAWRFVPAGTEGYRTAEVTRGGVCTDEVSSKTFESKKVPGLFFVGEVLDVTGWLGGFNFQWAWSSGYCAGLYI